MCDVSPLGVATERCQVPLPHRRPDSCRTGRLPQRAPRRATPLVSTHTHLGPVPRQAIVDTLGFSRRRQPDGEVRHASAAPLDASQQPGEVRSPLRVLIVDDVPEARDLLRWQLETDAGIEVVGEAADGRAGVQEAARLRPDLVILDLYMPHQGGFQTLPLMRKHVPDADVVVMTVLDSPAARSRASELGASGYVVKGVPRRELIDLIHSASSRADS